MHTDISIYKCIVKERLDKVKEETYGTKSYDKKNENIQWKTNLIFMMSILFT